MPDDVHVLVTTPFDDAKLARMRAVSPRLRVTRGDPHTADYSHADVLYAVTVPRDLVAGSGAPARAPRLRWAQVHMAGVDSLLQHPIYTQSDVALTTASGVHATLVAEYAITMLLALAHRVPRMIEWQATGGWPPDEQRWPLFLPSPVRGATLGIIGYGSIGRELARIARTAFAMRILACKRDPSRRADPGYAPAGTGDPEGRLPEAWFSSKDLADMLAQSDAVVMCAPLTGETRRMIGRAQLAAMKPSAYFINVGRGASVDERALAEALGQRRIAGAAVDVFAQEPPPAGHPLYSVDGAIVSPHVSGFMPTYDEACTTLFVENLRRYLAGEPLLNLVDRAAGY